MISNLIAVFLSILLLLMSVAFITLLERMILALSQSRKGPNKTLLGGVVQPLVDGIKLLIKGLILPSQALSLLFILGAAWIICLMIILWWCLKTLFYAGSPMFGCWFLILLLGLGVYGIFLSSFSSVSKYGLLGGLRGCVQSVSYEVCFSLVIFSFIMTLQHSEFNLWSSAAAWFLLPLWLFSHVAETNRAPFDFAEGESELISGLNIEFSSFPFALILVGEYGMVVCFSWFTSVMFLSGSVFLAGVWMLITLAIRSTFPRFRYDKLLAFCWTCVLPLAAAWSLVSFSLTSI